MGQSPLCSVPWFSLSMDTRSWAPKSFSEAFTDEELEALLEPPPLELELDPMIFLNSSLSPGGTGAELELTKIPAIDFLKMAKTWRKTLEHRKRKANYKSPERCKRCHRRWLSPGLFVNGMNRLHAGSRHRVGSIQGCVRSVKRAGRRAIVARRRVVGGEHWDYGIGFFLMKKKRH